MHFPKVGFFGARPFLVVIVFFLLEIPYLCACLKKCVKNCYGKPSVI